MNKLAMLSAVLALGLSTTAALAGSAGDDASRAQAEAATGAVLPPAATAGSGSSVQPMTLAPEMRARQILARDGYDQVSNMTRTRDGFEALAQREGKTIGVAVDWDGQVRRIR